MRAIPSTLMRGGTSKGLYFHAKDLPQSARARDRALLAAMGSPDPRQIDGVGGAHPLTSKVAIIGPSKRPDADVDYLFLQVVVDKAEVSDSQNCGNILAGVGPWSIEHGLVRMSRRPMGRWNTRVTLVSMVYREVRQRYRSTFWTLPVPRAAACCRPAPPSTASQDSSSPASTMECPSC